MLKKQVIAIGCDHAGFMMKQALLRWFDNQLGANLEIIDFGCESTESVDYPLYAKAVCESILRGEATHGILICGTGVGMCMVANRFPGIRAVVGSDVGLVKLSREHNNANVLCIGARIGASDYQIDLMIEVFLNTDFAGNNRHRRRIGQMEVAFTSTLDSNDDIVADVDVPAQTDWEDRIKAVKGQITK
jgi:ribose 5-phosphate isomerase B